VKCQSSDCVNALANCKNLDQQRLELEQATEKLVSWSGSHCTTSFGLLVSGDADQCRQTGTELSKLRNSILSVTNQEVAAGKQVQQAYKAQKSASAKVPAVPSPGTSPGTGTTIPPGGAVAPAAGTGASPPPDDPSPDPGAGSTPDDQTTDSGAGASPGDSDNPSGASGGDGNPVAAPVDALGTGGSSALANGIENTAAALGKTAEIDGLGSGSPAGPASFAAGTPGGTGKTDFSDPKTGQEFLLASVSGFKEPFDSMGLRVGAGPGGGLAVMHGDGTLASDQEKAELARRISQEPKALMKRPDFFDVLPRDQFEGLKKSYGEQALQSQEDFKHIGMTERHRDFQWSASCTRGLGSCNRNAGEKSYHAKDYVPPEDLRRIAVRQGVASSSRPSSGAPGEAGSGVASEGSPGPAADPMRPRRINTYRKGLHPAGWIAMARRKAGLWAVLAALLAAAAAAGWCRHRKPSAVPD
jgi:hypothetical protein